MPDVEGPLADLRGELRESMPMPDLDSVARRYRQRRTRRRMQIGAVAAVLAVSGVVPILRQLDAAPPSGTPPVVTSTGPELKGLRAITDLQFADHRNGYAVWTGCEDPVGVERPPCELILLATTDLEHWREVGPIPTPQRADVEPSGSLILLGPNEVVVEFADTVMDDTPQPARAHSDDGGRTWQWLPVPPAVTDVVPAIPEGAQLTPACGVERFVRLTCDTPTFTVVLPGSGTSAVLADPPPLLDPSPGAIPTADGHWWAAGVTPGTREWAVAVSTDDGRTWTTGALSADLPKYVQVSLASTDGILYAAVSGGDESGTHGVVGLFRSADDGRTWQRTWQRTGKPEEMALTTLVAADDGSLLLHEIPKVHVFTDGGRTLGVESQERLGQVTWTRAGYLSVGIEAFELSTDGRHWREYELPRG